jgi:hypothetical protein
MVLMVDYMNGILDHDEIEDSLDYQKILVLIDVINEVFHHKFE